MRTDIRPAAVTEPDGALLRLGLPADAAIDHLLVARRDGKPVGAAFAEVVGDGLAEVRPPAADDPATADALAVALMDRLRAAGVVVAQCLVPPDMIPAALVRVGFGHVTQLVTLRRDPAPLDSPQVILYIKTVSAADPALPATFAASLAGSLDLPELTGLRPPAVELADYPATHRFLAHHDGEPVGLVLLAAGEVLYLGVVPAARGRGFGRALLGLALTALRAGTTAVTVRADARNRPALRLYESHGFRRCRSQEVFLWTAGK